MNYNKKKNFHQNIQFRRRVKLFGPLICIAVLLHSCTSRVSYLCKNGSNNTLIYEDSIISIQQSNEVLGDELMISHLVRRKVNDSIGNYTINDVSDRVEGLRAKDSLSYSCGGEKYWYKKFIDIPANFRNFNKCPSYQIIYYYYFGSSNNDRLIVNTNVSLLINGNVHTSACIDTLTKHKTYHVPQP